MQRSRPAGQVTFENRGRVILVTGGSSGIGAAVCQAFTETGADVICLDVNLPPETSDAEFVRCNVAVDEDCEAAVQHVIDHFGGIDVLINNAAIQPSASYRPIDQVGPEVWQAMIDINLCGYLRMAKQVIPHMKHQGSGVILNMASGQAHRTAREVGIYGPIKAANVMQARQWAVEYARDGIRVNSISPGAIDTPMVRASLEAQGGAGALANRHPIGRIGRPSEVAAAALWLSSDSASFVTGADLEVDGGLGAFGAFADPYQMPNQQPELETRSH
ncbi:MAG: SDR family NAD(P)-dependent oxidoreductase [Rubripirellula sp.]|nr:SDR family NAD(P)-dependent oxidoreductase [Rubripirellula sp.]